MMIFIDAPPKTNILHLKMMVSKFGISSSRGSFSGSMLVFWGVSSIFVNIVIFESWEPRQPALSALPKLSHPSLLHKVPQLEKNKTPIELEFGTEIITLLRSCLRAPEKESGGCSFTKPSKDYMLFVGFKTLSPSLQKQRRDEPAKKPPKNSEDLHSIKTLRLAVLVVKDLGDLLHSELFKEGTRLWWALGRNHKFDPIRYRQLVKVKFCHTSNQSLRAVCSKPFLQGGCHTFGFFVIMPNDQWKIWLIWHVKGFSNKPWKPLIKFPASDSWHPCRHHPHHLRPGKLF